MTETEPRVHRRHAERRAVRSHRAAAYDAKQRRQTVQTVGGWLRLMERMVWYERARLAFRAWPEGWVVAFLAFCAGATAVALALTGHL